MAKHTKEEKQAQADALAPKINDAHARVIEVDAGKKEKLAKHIEQIRTLGKRVIADIIDIGNRLTECQRIIGHGHWERWLGDELQLSDRTALNFMRVAALAKSENFSDLNIPVSGVYLLARPSTPDAAKTEIIEKAKTGATVTHKDVAGTVAKHTPKSGAAAKPKSKVEVDLKGSTENVKLNTLKLTFETCSDDTKEQFLVEAIKGLSLDHKKKLNRVLAVVIEEAEPSS